MAYSIPIALVSWQTNDGSQGLKFDDGGGYGLIWPPNKPAWGWADEITFVISIGVIAGSPTTWSVGAKFQFLSPNTYNYPFQQPKWFDLQPEQIENCVVEKCGFYGGTHTAPLDGSYGTIADNTDTAPTATAPISVQRTIRNFGSTPRVVLSMAHTGGSTPRASIAITAILKAN